MPRSSSKSDGEAATLPSSPGPSSPGPSSPGPSPGADKLPEELEKHLDEDLEPGFEVGEYRIEGKLGEGGFGTVYGARHPLIGKMAAIKVLAREFSSNREMVSRFIAEARAVNTIRHTNIIDIFSFGTLDDGRHYFVMELLDGGTVDQFLAEDGPMDPPFALAVLRGVARALDAAHDSGIVHRDLKPENIFLTFDDDGRPVPKLLDFGIAKLTGEAKSISGHKTRTGAPIGTPQYMAPEQCIGESVDERSDVYAFGVVAFELLTGQPPFSDTNYLGLMNKQANDPRPAVSAIHPDLGTGFDDVIKKMMAIDPDERPPRAGQAHRLLIEAARAMGHQVDGPVSMPEVKRRPVGELASAATQPVSSLSTDTKPSSTRTIGGEEAPTTSRRGWLLGGAVALALAMFLVMGRSAEPGSEATPTSSTQRQQVRTARSSGVDETRRAQSEPSASGEASPAPPVDAPKTTTFTVQSKAPGATVHLDGRPLGPVPGPFEIASDDEVHRIVVRAPGRRDASIERSLRDGETLTLEPQPLAAPPLPAGPPRPAGKVDGDLELPPGY